MSDKGNRGWSGRALRTVREDAIIHFTEPITFGFFGSAPTGRSVPEAGRSALGLRGARFSIGRSAVLICVYVVFLSEAHFGVADGPPQGPGRSALSLFFQKVSPLRNNLRYSGQSI
jgi:hypothetical protein